MKEMIKKQKKFLRNNDGFVSVYFLAIFLYVISLSSVILLKEEMTLQTMTNMKQANVYLRMETEVLYDIKQRLLFDELQEEVILENCKYCLEREEHTLYVNVDGEESERLIITIDPEEKIVLDYVNERRIE